MEDIIQLLHEKNHCLEKFYDLNKDEINRAIVANFDNIENFYKTRDKILEMVQYLDDRMDDLHKRTQAISVMTQRDRDRVMKCLDRKDELAKAIIDQDLVLIGLIEQAKSEIIREIGTVSRAKRAMRGYGTSAIGS